MAKTESRTEQRESLIAQLKTVEQRARSVEEQFADAVKQYAPPAIRNSVADDLAVQIKSFAELPTQELDAMVSEAEAKIAQLKRECQQVRDVYTKHTTRIAEALKQIQHDVDHGIEAVKALQEQLAATAEPPPFPLGPKDVA
jgi:hypothetical protein